MDDAIAKVEVATSLLDSAQSPVNFRFDPKLA